MGLVLFKRNPRELTPSLCHVRVQCKMGESGSGLSLDKESAGTLISNFQPLELRERNVYILNHQVYGTFVIAAQT